MRRILWVIWLGLVGVAGGQDGPKKEFETPAVDVAGKWDFPADPALPNVLILGDSISIGYTRNVRSELAGKANVFRPLNPQRSAPVNCGDTEMGLAGIDGWLAGRNWSVIHCNWGLWDLCYRVPGKPKAGNRNKVNGKIAFTTEEYAANLEKILTKLEATGAKIIWGNTTWVPEGDAGRVPGDEVRFNTAAAAVMAKHNIPINDLHALTRTWAGKFSKPGDVHYNAAGNALLGKQVAAAIAQVLAPVGAAP
jgi:hypothetical protein